MKAFARTLSTAIFLFPALALAQVGHPTGGTIRILVTDLSGQPVAHAKVWIELVPHLVHGGFRIWETDASGHVSNNPVPWGTYEVYAIGPRQGAAMATWGFTKDTTGPTVTISPDAPEAEITVRTGPEPALLTPFAVVDAVTGKPITGTEPSSGQQLSLVSVSLTRVDKDNVPLRGVVTSAPVLATNTAQTKVFLPPLVPVMIKVSAPEYAEWYYPGTADKASAKPVILKPGEEFNIGKVSLTPLAAQANGIVTGVVLDENLRPVPYARIRLANAPVTAMNTEITFGADDAGRFVIPGVKWGTYTVQAMKVEDGYPDTYPMLYRYHVTQPTVTISPAQPLADVTVPVGPKAARIRPVVTDAVTGSPVSSAEVVLHRADQAILTATYPAGSENILIPSGIPMAIEIHCAGYADWYYPGAAQIGGTKLLTAKPGEQMTFEVRLRPLPNR